MQQATCVTETCNRGRELWLLIDHREINAISGRIVDRSDQTAIDRYVRKTVKVYAPDELVVKAVSRPLSVKHGDYATVLATIDHIHSQFYKRLVETLKQLDRRRTPPHIEASAMAVLHYAGGLLAELESRLADPANAEAHTQVRCQLASLARALSARLTRDSQFFDVRNCTARIPDRHVFHIQMLNAVHDCWLVSVLIE